MPSTQGLPDTTPITWTEAVNSLSALQEAIGVASNYTDRYLDRFLTQDNNTLRVKQAARSLASIYSIHTILVTGPSGSGKELIARALHWRPNSPFVPVNCAALPDTLLTSILFGHARGTFTGATEDRPGVFEAAGDGTVFLDEIGDMPASQQCALLRVLQEREVSRLGTTTTIPIRCRIVAATNAPEKLRDDLFGRLMAVHLPIEPLCTRPGDIHLIAKSLGLSAQDFSIDDPEIVRFGVRRLQAIATRKLIGLS